MKISNITQLVVTTKKPITRRTDHFLMDVRHVLRVVFFLVFFFDDRLIAMASINNATLGSAGRLNLYVGQIASSPRLIAFCATFGFLFRHLQR